MHNPDFHNIKPCAVRPTTVFLFFIVTVQESLAGAKESAQQQCVYECHGEEIAHRYQSTFHYTAVQRLPVDG